MDCLQIDWADVAREDAFVRDEFYESIQAPKWIDFTAPLEPVDDHEWFGGNASDCIHEEKSFDTPAPDANVDDVIESKPSATRKTTGRLSVSASLSSLPKVKGNGLKSMSRLPPIADSNCMEKKAMTIKRPTSRQNSASENVNPNQARATKHSSASFMSKAFSRVSGSSKESRECKAQVSESSMESRVCKTKVSESSKESRAHNMRASRDYYKLFTNRVSISSEKEAAMGAAGRLIARNKDGILQQGKKNQTPTKKQQLEDLGGSAQNVNKCKRVEEGCKPSVHHHHHLMASLSIMPSKEFTLKSSHSDSNVHSNETQGEDSLDGNIKNKIESGHASDVGMDENARKNGFISALEEEERECRENLPEYCHGKSSKHRFVADDSIISPRTAVLSMESSSVMQNDDQGLHEKEVKDKPTTSTYQYYQQTTMKKVDCVENGSTLEELFLKSLCIDDADPIGHCNNLGEEQRPRPRCSSSNSDNDAREDDMDETESMQCSSSSQSTVTAHEMKSSSDSASNPWHCLDRNCEVSITRTISSEDLVHSEVQDHAVSECLRPDPDRRTSCGIIKKRKSSEIILKINCNYKARTPLKQEIQKLHGSRAFTGHWSSLNPQSRQTMAASSNGQSNSCTSTLVKPFRLRTEERVSRRRKGLVRRSNSEELIEKALRIRTSVHQPFRPQRSTKKLTVPKEPKFHQSARSKRASAITPVTEQFGSGRNVDHTPALQ